MAFSISVDVFIDLWLNNFGEKIKIVEKNMFNDINGEKVIGWYEWSNCFIIPVNYEEYMDVKNNPHINFNNIVWYIIAEKYVDFLKYVKLG